MTREIRIYVEGGGDSAHGKGRLRQGFNSFFRSFHDDARSQKIRLDVVAMGPRNKCFDAFCTALRSHPGAFNILLVDSEGPVSSTVRQHLRERDAWDVNAPEHNCHLMVQTMEAWLVADIEALKQYYGQGFAERAIPARPNVEQIEKADLEAALIKATQHTQKGGYKKLQHGAELLEQLDTIVVRRKAQHCDRLFHTLHSVIGGTS
ncbi:MAG: DUF4276 family protein [Chloroflexi bacterium]|nr:DUF4276 family protein [Chloroflexota bacterium]